mmetsp:Transcript_5752/g.9149  ORF Transcript_5752/g.9149 Transcript_5752/m.9149 type:complete len:174 (+) Transcript_5752:128-649(+)
MANLLKASAFAATAPDRLHDARLSHLTQDSTKESILAQQEALGNVDEEEAELLKTMFTFDHEGLTTLIGEWEHSLKLDLQEIILHTEFLDLRDPVAEASAKAFTCMVCRGLARTPVTSCSRCEQVFCQYCIDDLREKELPSLIFQAEEVARPFHCPKCACEFIGQPITRREWS